ncbi:MAG: FmdB family zinc ribbon protein [Capsulimonadaceae bacterium]
MPIFEYTCNDCRRCFSVLVGMTAVADCDACPHCGSLRSTKRIGRFAALRGDEEMLERLGDPDAVGDIDDPASMRRWAREVGRTMGEDLGDDFDDYLEESQ